MAFKVLTRRDTGPFPRPRTLPGGALEPTEQRPASWRPALRLRLCRQQLRHPHSPGDGGCSLGCFLVSPVLKTSGGGSSPRSILHSKANRYWMYCFFRELAALLEVPTFRLVASSRHFLFLLTWQKTPKRQDHWFAAKWLV